MENQKIKPDVINALEVYLGSEFKVFEKIFKSPEYIAHPGYIPESMSADGRPVGIGIISGSFGDPIEGDLSEWNRIMDSIENYIKDKGNPLEFRFERNLHDIWPGYYLLPNKSIIYLGEEENITIANLGTSVDRDFKREESRRHERPLVIKNKIRRSERKINVFNIDQERLEETVRELALI